MTSGSDPRFDAITGMPTAVETAAVTARDNLLPIGVAVGCTLRRDVPKDRHLTYDDVEVPPGRLVDRLRAEQDALFGLQRPATAAAPEAAK